MNKYCKNIPFVKFFLKTSFKITDMIDAYIKPIIKYLSFELLSINKYFSGNCAKYETFKFFSRIRKTFCLKYLINLKVQIYLTLNK